MLMKKSFSFSVFVCLQIHIEGNGKIWDGFWGIWGLGWGGGFGGGDGEGCDVDGGGVLKKYHDNQFLSTQCI